MMKMKTMKLSKKKIKTMMDDIFIMDMNIFFYVLFSFMSIP